MVSIGKDFDYGTRILKNSKGIKGFKGYDPARPIHSTALTASKAYNVLIFKSALPYSDIFVTV